MKNSDCEDNGLKCSITCAHRPLSREKRSVAMLSKFFLRIKPRISNIKLCDGEQWHTKFFFRKTNMEVFLNDNRIMTQWNMMLNRGMEVGGFKRKQKHSILQNYSSPQRYLIPEAGVCTNYKHFLPLMMTKFCKYFSAHCLVLRESNK